MDMPETTKIYVPETTEMQYDTTKIYVPETTKMDMLETTEMVTDTTKIYVPETTEMGYDTTKIYVPETTKMDMPETTVDPCKDVEADSLAGNTYIINAISEQTGREYEYVIVTGNDGSLLQERVSNGRTYNLGAHAS